jgi:hypothetical protein
MNQKPRTHERRGHHPFRVFRVSARPAGRVMSNRLLPAFLLFFASAAAAQIIVAARAGHRVAGRLKEALGNTSAGRGSRRTGPARQSLLAAQHPGPPRAAALTCQLRYEPKDPFWQYDTGTSLHDPHWPGGTPRNLHFIQHAVGASRRVRRRHAGPSYPCGPNEIKHRFTLKAGPLEARRRPFPAGAEEARHCREDQAMAAATSMTRISRAT